LIRLVQNCNQDNDIALFEEPPRWLTKSHVPNDWTLLQRAKRKRENLNQQNEPESERTAAGQIQRKERPLLVVCLLFVVAVAALVVVLATTSRNHHPGVGKPLLYLSAVPTVAPKNTQSRRLKDNDAESEKPISIEWSAKWLTHEATTVPPKKNKSERPKESIAASCPNSATLPWSMTTAMEWNPATWLVVDGDATETQTSTATRPESKRRLVGLSSARNVLIQLGLQLKRLRGWLRRAFGKKP
jgi:hypothetical protein